jgi:peroxiredoxin
MTKVFLNSPAPEFSLQNFKGEMVHLSDFKDRSNVLLVFNRGFV